MNALLLAAIPSFLRAVSSSLGSVVGDPAHNAKGSALTSALSVAASLIERGEAGSEALAALTEHIRTMVAERAEPSAEEWAELKKRSDAAHATLQASSAPQEGAPSADSQPPT